MIYASLNAKKGNYEYPAAIATALEFLAKPETKELPGGRYELDGDNIYVLIQDQTTAPVEKKRAESHRNYIDSQYLFTGKEEEREERILGIKNILNAFTTRAFRIFLSGIY